MTRYLLTVALLLLPSVCTAELFKVDNVRVVDGDTVSGRVDFSRGLYYEGLIRATYDTWESSRARRSLGLRSRQWEIENAKGRKATVDLATLVTEGELHLFLRDGTNLKESMGVYGRFVGKYVVVTPENKFINVGDWMEERGHLRK